MTGIVTLAVPMSEVPPCHRTVSTVAHIIGPGTIPLPFLMLEVEGREEKQVMNFP